ncbi:MAG: 4-(cytidine 5'-diphospho)-2-C-methyl-D-erythritol kinase [Moraxella sp.]|nr:4-(cytidine 5'-diphospho)-2-C-methyl-D-erythritol kinase [Moraxella sp.]
MTHIPPNSTLCVKSHAKLNLFLHITGKRPDGYHNLQSVFCRLDWHDTLSFSPALHGDALVTLTGADGLTDTPTDNLITKAAFALAKYSEKTGIGTPFSVNIALEKRLPTGAGLGGGSSNAATTLSTLNQLWQTCLDTEALITLGASLGADVPFFLLDHPYAIAEGKGEQLHPITLEKRRFLLLLPDVHNATVRFFSDDRLKKDSPHLPHTLLDGSGFLDRLTPPFYNAFEDIAKDSPAITDALSYLATLAPHTQTTPRLTGTGSTVFLPLPDTLDAVTLAQWQKNAPCPSHIATSQ